jgi:hypothetical protein
MNSALKMVFVWLRDYITFWLLLAHGIMLVVVWIFLVIFTYHGVNSPLVLLELAGLITLCSLITSTPAYFVADFPGLERYRNVANTYLVYGLVFGIVALIISAFLKQPHPQALVVGITVFATGVSMLITIAGLARDFADGRRMAIA